MTGDGPVDISWCWLLLVAVLGPLLGWLLGALAELAWRALCRDSTAAATAIATTTTAPTQVSHLCQ